MKRRMFESGVIKLCGVQGCCPTVDFTDPQKIVFRDDFGGKVQLTQAQWQEMKMIFVSDATQKSQLFDVYF